MDAQLRTVIHNTLGHDTPKSGCITDRGHLEPEDLPTVWFHRTQHAEDGGTTRAIEAGAQPAQHIHPNEVVRQIGDGQNATLDAYEAKDGQVRR